MAIRYYRALMSLEPDGSCGVVFPELPGCLSHGNDLNSALRRATEALEMQISAMIEDGDAVPPALPVDALCPSGWSKPPTTIASIGPATCASWCRSTPRLPFP